MTSALLATNAIVFGAVGAIAALSFVYGIFKKSSRMSWIGWQVLLVFALTFALGVLKGSGLLIFFVAVGIVFLAAAGLY
ncbi:MAG: hypothetical protein K2N74_05890, partial [Clostridiales bacterium]|nr:hypothetical protein [Clostridiales bacterium]